MYSIKKIYTDKWVKSKIFYRTRVFLVTLTFEIIKEKKTVYELGPKTELCALPPFFF